MRQSPTCLWRHRYNIIHWARNRTEGEIVQKIVNHVCTLVVQSGYSVQAGTTQAPSQATPEKSIIMLVNSVKSKLTQTRQNVREFLEQKPVRLRQVYQLAPREAALRAAVLTAGYKHVFPTDENMFAAVLTLAPLPTTGPVQPDEPLTGPSPQSPLDVPEMAQAATNEVCAIVAVGAGAHVMALTPATMPGGLQPFRGAPAVNLQQDPDGDDRDLFGEENSGEIGDAIGGANAAEVAKAVEDAAVAAEAAKAAEDAAVAVKAAAAAKRKAAAEAARQRKIQKAAGECLRTISPALAAHAHAHRSLGSVATVPCEHHYPTPSTTHPRPALPAVCSLTNRLSLSAV